jgi:2,4-dienoyl-CoA reductase (NADPH2)
LARLAWERTLRERLYANWFDFLVGKELPRKGADAAFRKVEGINRVASRAIRSAVAAHEIKVLCTGAFQTLAGIRDAIAKEDCDAVTMVRPLLANPTLPTKILAAEKAGAGDYEAEEPCTLCNRCLLAAPEFPVGCLDERRYQNESSIYSVQYDCMIRNLFKLYQDASGVEGPAGR